MRNPFLRSAGPRFVDVEEVLALARDTALRIAAEHPEVIRILLFGSFARGDYGTRSDLDVLIILHKSDKSIAERLDEFLRYCPSYPTDMFPLTESEVESRLRQGDLFLRRAVSEGIVLYSRNGE
jgi:predicted nucleotidyltransferase